MGAILGVLAILTALVLLTAGWLLGREAGLQAASATAKLVPPPASFALDEGDEDEEEEPQAAGELASAPASGSPYRSSPTGERVQSTDELSAFDDECAGERRKLERDAFEVVARWKQAKEKERIAHAAWSEAYGRDLAAGQPARDAAAAARNEALAELEALAEEQDGAHERREGEA